MGFGHRSLANLEGPESRLFCKTRILSEAPEREAIGYISPLCFHGVLNPGWAFLGHLS